MAVFMMWLQVTFEHCARLCGGRNVAEQGPSPQSATRRLSVCRIDVSIPSRAAEIAWQCSSSTEILSYIPDIASAYK